MKTVGKKTHTAAKGKTALTKRKKVLSFVIDVLLCGGSYFVASWASGYIRAVPVLSWDGALSFAICSAPILAAMLLFNCYSVLRRYSGRVDVAHIMAAHAVSAVLLIAATAITEVYTDGVFIPLTNALVYNFILTSAFLTMGCRFLPWFFKYFLHLGGRFRSYGENRPKRTLIFGAGYTGAYFIGRFMNNPSLGFKPVAVVDDDPSKHGMSLNGIKVAGGGDVIAFLARKYRVDTLLIAAQQIKRSRLLELSRKCRELNLSIKIAPPLKDENSRSDAVISNINMEDLFGREERNVRRELIERCVLNKKVLVTGGAGSIGSELCRQVLEFNCAHLVVFDMHENGVFEISNELEKKYRGRFTCVVGNVRDEARLREVFAKYKFDTVFHAAAYKHVHIMEENVCEAVKTNVFGTLNVAEACIKHKVGTFISVSTDKAVNPAGVMGATKRIAEMVVQARGVNCPVKMAAVRFGNVVGSSGSAIPFFLKQIEEGGPVTVTHREIKRYFMTIPEAVSLVLQAGAFAASGEVFTLDMGEPVRIYDLAEDLIRLSGREPHKDIEIKIIGLRKGEKLFEELNFDDETCYRTSHEAIYAARLASVDGARLDASLKTLKVNAAAERSAATERTVFEIVPTAYREKTAERKSRARRTRTSERGAGGVVQFWK